MTCASATRQLRTPDRAGAEPTEPRLADDEASTSRERRAAVTAQAHARPLAVAAARSAGIGRPARLRRRCRPRALTGITLYEPAELVIAARPARRSPRSRRRWPSKGQMLPFEPPDYRALLGTQASRRSARVAAGNISGPRRIQAGAARDSLIGVRFVNGRGEVDQVRRAGDEERHRPRPREAHGGLLGHARRLDRGHLQGAAQAPSARRPWCSTGSTTRSADRGHAAGARLALRGQRRGAPARPTRRRGREHAAAHRGLRGLGRLPRRRADSRCCERFGAADVHRGRRRRALWRDDARRGVRSAEPRDRAVWRVSIAPTQGAARCMADDRRARSTRATSTIGAAASSGSPSRRPATPARRDPRGASRSAAATRR